ncbi:MAG: flavin reductase [Nocardiopsaceae bacterium]|nr:flavin reductase [Nocardiopsaceae bacterium]
MPVDLQALAPADLIATSGPAATVERPEPSALAARFQQGIKHLVNGVTVVTSADDGTWYGIMTTSVCTLSADPPTLIACVRRRSQIGQRMGRARRFCVNLLSEQQRTVAEAFTGPPGADGSPGPRAGGFGHGQWVSGATGCPVLEDALASFECGVDLMYGYSGQVVIIGAVLQFRQSDDALAPLASAAGQFCHVMPVADPGRRNAPRR